MRYLNHLLYIVFSILFLQLCGGELVAQTPEEADDLLLNSLINDLNTQKLTNIERINNFFQVGIIYNKKGMSDSARYYFHKATEVPGGREFQAGRIIVNIANSYAYQGKYAKALKHYMEALEIAESKNDFENHGNTIRSRANISEIYYMMGNYSQALYYAETAYKKYIYGIGAEYILPQIFYVMGSVYLERGDFDKAKEYMVKTYDISESIYQHGKNEGGILIYKSYGMEGLTRISLIQKDYKSAMEYVQNALEFAKGDGNTMVIAKAYASLSDIYLDQKQYKNSYEAAEKAIEISSTAIELNPSIAFNMGVYNMFLGNNEEAYRYFKIHSDQIKKNTDKNFRETIASMEIQYETEKKEVKISSLERQRILYISISFIGVLLAITVYMLFYLKVRQERQEKKLMIADAISEGENKERERLGSDIHDSIGSMLSALKFELNDIKNLQSIRARLDECIEELRRLVRGLVSISLQRYGMKAALEDHCRSFPNVFFHFFGEDKRIYEKMESAVYFCARELVNNSIKHSGATIIDVQLVQDSNRISLTVQDNGCGFDKESIVQGLGMRSLNNRVAALNGKIDIVSSFGKGTETTIELKINNI